MANGGASKAAGDRGAVGRQLRRLRAHRRAVGRLRYRRIHHKLAAAADTPEHRHVSSHVWDLPEFLCDVLDIHELPWAEFPSRGRTTRQLLGCPWLERADDVRAANRPVVLQAEKPA